MSEYSFRLAHDDEAAFVRAFVRRHWGAPHPLIEQDDFFNYYYRDGTGENAALHFALCEEDGRLVAAAGYILASQREKPDVWVSLWVADETARGSGLALMDALPRLTGCRTLACNNIRPETQPLYHFLGYETGRVSHFYRLANQPAYQLAVVVEKDIPALVYQGGAALQHLPNAEALGASGFIPPQAANPYKDLAYTAKRYYRYPHQHYDVYGLMAPGKTAPAALLCTRTIPAAGTAVLRIADYIGPPDVLPQAGPAIDALLRKTGAEYADLYCVGLSSALLRRAGFAERRENSPNIIPNYLNPPLRENTEYYYFTSRPENFTLFKADGDQDRPRILTPP